jgi:hypothetical protein
MSADYDYGYLYYSKPCLSAPGQQKAIYYRKKIIEGIADAEEPVPLPDNFAHGMILEVIGPDYAYMVQPDGKLGFASLDGRATGEVVLRDKGIVEDYTYPEMLGRGDNGFYYKIQLAGTERVMHVDSQNQATLIAGPDRDRLHIPNVYAAPALWIDFDTDQARIRSINRVKDQKPLVDAAYFTAHGWIYYRTPQDIVPQASVDGRVLAITGDVSLKKASDSDTYRQNRIVVLRDNGPISEHTGDPYAFGINEVKLSPSGKFYAYSLGEHIFVYDSNDHKQILDVKAAEYVKYLAKSQYEIHYKTDDQMVLSDGDGFSFNLNLR